MFNRREFLIGSAAAGVSGFTAWGSRPIGLNWIASR